MTRILVGIVGTLVATASFAHADPSTVIASAEEPAPAEPTSYLQTGAQVGVIADQFAVAGVIDGGHLVGHDVWIHGRLAAGEGGDWDGGNGTVFEMRAGLEVRPCVLDGAVCAMVGADLGFAQANLDTAMQSEQHLIGLLRTGLDVGTRVVRVRPGIEIGADEQGRATDLSAELGLAFRW